MYAKNLPGMKQLRAQHPVVKFIIAYVREAHSGERLNQHQTFDEKISALSMANRYLPDMVRFRHCVTIVWHIYSWSR